MEGQKITIAFKGDRLRVNGDPGLSLLSTYVRGLAVLPPDINECLTSMFNSVEKPLRKILKGGIFVPLIDKIVDIERFDKISRKEDPDNPPKILKIYHSLFGNTFIAIPRDLIENINYTVSEKGKCDFTYTSPDGEIISLDDLRKMLNKYVDEICNTKYQCNHIVPPRIIVDQLLVDIAKTAQRRKQKSKESKIN